MASDGSPRHAIAASVQKALADRFGPTVLSTPDEIADVVAEHFAGTNQTPLLARQVAENLVSGLKGVAGMADDDPMVAASYRMPKGWPLLQHGDGTPDTHAVLLSDAQRIRDEAVDQADLEARQETARDYRDQLLRLASWEGDFLDNLDMALAIQVLRPATPASTLAAIREGVRRMLDVNHHALAVLQHETSGPAEASAAPEEEDGGGTREGAGDRAPASAAPASLGQLRRDDVEDFIDETIGGAHDEDPRSFGALVVDALLDAENRMVLATLAALGGIEVGERT